MKNDQLTLFEEPRPLLPSMPEQNRPIEIPADVWCIIGNVIWPWHNWSVAGPCKRCGFPYPRRK